MSNRLVLWVGGVVSVLLIAVVVVVLVMVNTLNAQAEDAAFRDCMARYGFAADDPSTSVESDGIDVAFEVCSR